MEDNKPIMLAQANALTQARYDFNPIEKRCLYQIIREVRSKFIDTNTGQRDLFNNMRISLPPSALVECQNGKHSSVEVYESLKKLRKRDIEIDTEEEWMNTGYVTMVKHYKKENRYEVEVSSEILPYLVALAENFTTYDLTVAITLKSAYSQRFYEFCCQYRNRSNKTFFFSIEQLKEMMMLENKYPNSADFRRKVIEVAQKELKEAYDKGQCDLYFDYNIKDKQGKKVLSWFFFIHTREDQESKPDYMSVNECIVQIGNILKTFFPRDKGYIKRAIAAIQLRPEIAEPVLLKLRDRIVVDYDRKSVAPVIRYALEQDFAIK